MELCALVGARQASFGIFTGEDSDGTGGEWPWTLRESFQECTLSREYGRRGPLVATLPDDADKIAMFDALAKCESWMTWQEQQEWIKRTYPDEFDAEGKWIG